MSFAYAKQQLGDLEGARECARKIFSMPDPGSRVSLYACSILRELGEKLDAETASHVFGVVAETGIDNTVVIVAGYEDGSSRLFLGTGSGVSGEKKDFPPQTIAAAQKIVQSARAMSENMFFEQNRRLPSQGQVRFAFLTGEGIRSVFAPAEQLDDGNPPELYPLWLAAKELRESLQKFLAEGRD
jgi:hypothetical protein